MSPDEGGSLIDITLTVVSINSNLIWSFFLYFLENLLIKAINDLINAIKELKIEVQANVN